MNANNGIIAIAIKFLVFNANLSDFKGLEIDYHLPPINFLMFLYYYRLFELITLRL